MISSIVSRLVILVFGTLYPAYASYKAVRTKNVKEYVKWMMYWIVFALFTCAETFTDVFLSFWFPFYYEIKIILVLWLLSPATKGSSILYRKFVHPMLSRREQEIDEYIAKAKEQGYHTVLHLGSKGVNYATTVLMQTAIKGGGGLVNQLRKSYSLSDLSSDKDSDLNRNSKALKNVQDDDELEEETDGTMDPRMLRSRGYSPRRSASGSGRVEMYFPEVDVDVRQRGASRPRDPSIPLSHIRSTEDVSSGYSSAEPLYAGHPATKSEGLSASREPLVRTASVGSTRSMRTKSSRGGVVAKRGPAAEGNELVDEGDEAENSKQEEYFYDLAPSPPLQTSLPIVSPPTYTTTPFHNTNQKQFIIYRVNETYVENVVDTDDSLISAPDEELPLYDAETDVSEVLSSTSLELSIGSVPSYDETTISVGITEIVKINEEKCMETNRVPSCKEIESQILPHSVSDANNSVAPSLSSNAVNLEANLKDLENSCTKVLEAAENKFSDQMHSDSKTCCSEKVTNNDIKSEDCLENNEHLEVSKTVNSPTSELSISPLTSPVESALENSGEGNKTTEQIINKNENCPENKEQLEASVAENLSQSKPTVVSSSLNESALENSKQETTIDKPVDSTEICTPLEMKETSSTVLDKVTEDKQTDNNVITSSTVLDKVTEDKQTDSNVVNDAVTDTKTPDIAVKVDHGSESRSCPIEETTIDKQVDSVEICTPVEIKETSSTALDKVTEDKQADSLAVETNNVVTDTKTPDVAVEVDHGSESIPAVKAEVEVFTSVPDGSANETKVEQETNENGSTYGSVESLSPDEMPIRSLSQSNIRAGRYNKAPAPSPPKKSESEPEIWTDTTELLELPKEDEKSSSVSPSPSPTPTVKEIPLDKEVTENDSISPESSITTARLVLKPGVVRSLGPDSENKSEVFVSKPSQNKGRKYKSKQKHGESSFSKLFAFPKASSLTSLIPFWHGNKQNTSSTQHQSSSTASAHSEQTGDTSVYISLHEEAPDQKRTNQLSSGYQDYQDGDIDYSHLARTPVQSRKAPLAKVE